MSKTASIIFVCILTALIVFLGVFSFLTDLPVGDYKVYYAPSDLIQLGSEFTSTEEASYTIDTSDMDDDELETLASNLTTVINDRLGAVYGYYNSDITISEDLDKMYINIPTTTAHDETTASDILTNVVVVGLVEFIDVDSDEYSADVVLMSYEDGWFKTASVSEYINGTDTYYIVEVKLTSDGLSEANDVLDHSSSSASAIVTIDGALSYYVYHTEATNSVTIYTSSRSDANVLASYFNYGILSADVTLINSAEVANDTNLLTVVALVFAGLVLAMLVVFFVKFGTVAWGSIMTIVTTGILCVILSGLGYFSVFNIYAVIGFVLGLVLLAYCMWLITKGQFDNKTKSNNIMLGFKAAWLRVLIVCGSVLVLGIILWVIPCAVTVSLGNALVYSAVLSAFGVLVLRWLFAGVTKAFIN